MTRTRQAPARVKLARAFRQAGARGLHSVDDIRRGEISGNPSQRIHELEQRGFRFDRRSERPPGVRWVMTYDAGDHAAWLTDSELTPETAVSLSAAMPALPVAGGAERDGTRGTGGDGDPASTRDAQVAAVDAQPAPAVAASAPELGLFKDFTRPDGRWLTDAIIAQRASQCPGCGEPIDAGVTLIAKRGTRWLCGPCAEGEDRFAEDFEREQELARHEGERRLGDVVAP